MKRKIACFLLIFTMIMNVQTLSAFASKNPSHEEIEAIIEEVARRKNIPSVILKAIAWKESAYRQFDSKGNPFICNNDAGIMQINSVHKNFDRQRLKYDIQYNIEAGADVLLSKWNEIGKKLPTIGNQNPNILENWYFAIWAYNGWLERNNPNVTGKRAYQEDIFHIIRTRYNQPVSGIDWSLLPKRGLPSGNLHIENPEVIHYGDLEIYDHSTVAFVDVRGQLNVRQTPGGEVITQIPKNNKVVILDGPKLHNGLYWYYIRVKEDNIEGWVSGHHITPIPSDDRTVVSRGSSRRTLFRDIIDHPKRSHIEALLQKDIINGVGNQLFLPDAPITREQVATVIVKALQLNLVSKRIIANDWMEVSDWAMDFVSTAYQHNIITRYQDNTIRPKGFVTREEALVMIYQGLGEKVDKGRQVSVPIQYMDMNQVSPWAVESIQYFVHTGLLSIQNNEAFRPHEYITRAELCEWVNKVMEHFSYF